MAQASWEGFQKNTTHNYVTRTPEEFDSFRHKDEKQINPLGLDTTGTFIAALILCVFFGAIVAKTKIFFMKLILCCIFIGVALKFFSSSFALFALGSSLGMLFGHPDEDSPNLGVGFFMATTVIGVLLMIAGLIGCIRNTFF